MFLKATWKIDAADTWDNFFAVPLGFFLVSNVGQLALPARMQAIDEFLFMVGCLRDLGENECWVFFGSVCFAQRPPGRPTVLQLMT